MKVTLAPLHTVVDEALATTVGLLFTVMVIVAVFEQAPLVPVTVYVPVDVGK